MELLEKDIIRTAEEEHLLREVYQVRPTTTADMGKEEDDRLAKAIAKEINAAKGSGSSGGGG